MYAEFTKPETLVADFTAAQALIGSRSASDVAGARTDITKGLLAGILYLLPVNRTAAGVQFNGHAFNNHECLVAYVLEYFW